MDIPNIRISDYLESKRDKRGLCKLCSTEVYWTTINLIRHKRSRCPISEDEKTFWEAENSPVLRARKLGDFLDNKNPVTKRGTCKLCGMQVYWSNMHLATHKRNKCKISDEDRLEWEISLCKGQFYQKKQSIKIGDFLENKNPSTRRGNCIVCGSEVYWSVQSMINHKRKNCIDGGTSTDLWLNFDKTTFEENIESNLKPSKKVEKTHKQIKQRLSSTDIISEYLINKNPLTRYTNFVFFFTSTIYRSLRKLNEKCHKHWVGEQITQKKKYDFRRGTCINCQSSVFWTISHLLLHKLRKCPIPETDKLYWTNVQEKLIQAKNSKEDEINIGNYLTNKNTVTRRGTCKVCHKRVFWATLHLASHKKSKCPISEKEKIYWSTLRKGNNLNIYVERDQKEIENRQKNNIDGNLKKKSSVTPKSNFANDIEYQPYICDICNKKFSKKQTLKQHISNHLQCDKLLLETCQPDREEIDSTNVVFENFQNEEGKHYNENNCVYNKKSMAEQKFECCQKMYTFSSLARHQFNCHIESFHMMISSMKKEISNSLSLTDSYVDCTSKHYSSEYSKELVKFNSKINKKATNDSIIKSIIVQCFICQKECSAVFYDKHLAIAHPLEDSLNAKRATNKFSCNWCQQTFGRISDCITHIKNTCSEYPGISFIKSDIKVVY